ncbi:hypothetical protein M4951_05155 [Blastopirellula sp. J2-11]|uniref:hypothetical protein n=1 Tax=Blastopirellula sp. J2-11 TaxID=2943192 RepID=UPI0021C946F7|nr:hypothetical protein [Blastopirellula sp. J2-11]UUO07697.1 hypothetical protein M4951_05155 [Blastopirellula sp. J2-11]
MEDKEIFLQFLAHDYSAGYWSDVAILEAGKLAKPLPAADWIILCDAWRSYEPLVQARIAEVAGDVTPWRDEIGAMLISMLASDDPDVVEASVDSLHQQYQAVPQRFNREHLAESLKSVSARSGVAGIALGELRKKLK